MSSAFTLIQTFGSKDPAAVERLAVASTDGRYAPIEQTAACRGAHLQEASSLEIDVVMTASYACAARWIARWMR